MWNNFVSSATEALEKTTAALEKTGDVLTEKATQSARMHSQKLAAETAATGTGTGGANTSQQPPQPVPGPGVDLDKDDREQVRLTAQRVLTATDESHVGEPSPANAAAAAAPGHASFSRLRESVAGLTLSATADPTAAAAADVQKQKEQMLSNLSKGWGSVVSATKNAANQARETIEKEQSRLQATFSKGPYRRDPKLPLDVDALRDAEVVYITDRLITMGHPAMQSSTDGDITAERKLAAVGHLLDRRHGGRYMVWNLSEVEYEYSVLDDQVLTYQFPGSPAPPLGLMLKLLMSIESWLKSDPQNVAVLHCLTGRGRTSTVLAAFLCWTGEAGFHDPNSALEYIAKCKRLSVETLTIPSQRRYTNYFTNMLDGVRPSQPPLLLKRIIMSEAPKFGKRPPPLEGAPASDKPDELGCSPYLQIFKAGNLVFTTAAAMSYSQSENDLPFCCPSDGPISFNVETIVQGDILIRCRHLTRKGQRVSMFRAAFHTGYIPPKVMRLTKTQLDGACSDRRYADDFFLDLIFEACDAEMASKHLLNAPKEEEEENVAAMAEETAQNEAAARRQGGTVTGATANVSATAYDTMLHRDSRFWEVIAERRRENTKKMASAGAIEDDDDDALEKKYCGPTIGRRRDLQTGKGGGKDGDGGKNEKEQSSVQPTQEEKKAIEAFSIGGEFDFLGADEEDQSGADHHGTQTPVPHVEEDVPPTPPKKDDLMDALMALDEDDEIDTPSPVATRKKEPEIEQAQTQTKADASDLGTEEVVFEHNSENAAAPVKTEPIAATDVAQTQEVEQAPVAAESAPVVAPVSETVDSEATTAVPEENPVLPSVDSTPADTTPVPASAPEPTSSPAPVPPTETQTQAPTAVVADEDELAPTAAPSSEKADISAEDALAELGIDLPDMDEELEAELEASGADGAGVGDTSALGDDFDFDFDDDDDELEDLEAFLSKA